MLKCMPNKYVPNWRLQTENLIVWHRCGNWKWGNYIGISTKRDISSAQSTEMNVICIGTFPCSHLKYMLHTSNSLFHFKVTGIADTINQILTHQFGHIPGIPLMSHEIHSTLHAEMSQLEPLTIIGTIWCNDPIIYYVFFVTVLVNLAKCRQARLISFNENRRDFINISVAYYL